MFLISVANPVASAINAVNEPQDGVMIAIAGMLIVGFALLLICLFLWMLPRILAVVEIYWPEVKHPHGGSLHPESLVPDDDAVLAAIGFVLHQEFQRQLQPAERSAGH